MDFVRYAERAAELVNASLDDATALAEHLSERPRQRTRVTEADAARLREFQHDVRPVFEASDAGDASGVVAQVNDLLRRHPITPYITGHDAEDWHLHVADDSASVADLLMGESVLGLAMLVCDLGATRLGVCAAAPCTRVFVDTSPNQSRRYCSERCASRANVAAYRARQKAVTGG